MIELHTKIALVVMSVALVNAGSIGISDKVKRNVDSDLFPDWVPFKNKHGDELGEFVQVKAKPKKRLALPMNFMIRSFEDEFDDSRGGGGDSEDYYENKNWSDTDRPALTSNASLSLNHTDLKDIEGIVKIITSPVSGVLKQIRDTPRIDFYNNNDPPQETATAVTRSDNESEQDDDDDAEESTEGTGKKTPEVTEEEQKEAEERKAKILSSVDELKMRHAAEQSALSYKTKEEEKWKDDIARAYYDNDRHKYDDGPKKYIDQQDDDTDDFIANKYQIPFNTEPPAITSTKGKQHYTTTREPETKAPKKNDEKPKEVHKKKPQDKKIALFKNPQAYMLEESEEDTTTPRTIDHTNERISLVPTSTKNDEPALFIPLVKKKKNRSFRTTTTPAHTSKMTTVSDSSGAADMTSPDVTDAAVSAANTAPSAVESSGPDESSTSAIDSAPSAIDSAPSAVDSAPSAVDSAPSAIDSAPSAVETAPSAIDTSSETTALDVVTENDTSPSVKKASKVTSSSNDVVSASSNHERKHHDDHKDEHHESGGGHEHHKEHESEHGEHGKKGYESTHHDKNTKKGHHDKNDHLEKYDDHGGIDKHHHESKKHFGEHHHTEEGKKHAKYEESGKHSKGHSTKGSHDVHKKEEYEKKVEFFEEDGDSGEEDKFGGFNHEKKHHQGGRFRKSNNRQAHLGYHKGEKEIFANGGHTLRLKAHKKQGGHDSHGKKQESGQNLGGHEEGKHWVYHHGFPARTANLAIVDKRADGHNHGLLYL